MAYRVFSGRRCRPTFRAHQERMLFKEFNSVDEALWWARHLDSERPRALLIEGDDACVLNRREIGEALARLSVSRSASSAGDAVPF